MKVGVIGLGGIAQKAYLPTYIKLQDRGEFIFATRNKEVQTRLSTQYGLPELKNNLQELIVEGIEACFIHTATSSHYELIKTCLLANIHVFVDKPISENIEEVTELQALAKERQCILMVGFNRRFAPMVEKLKQIPEKRTLILQKNRAYSEQPTAFEIFDLFLHLVDTAVYLLDDEIISSTSRIRESETGMETAVLHLETATTTAILSMDLKSGANREVFQVTAPSGTTIVENLIDFKTVTSVEQSESFNDWQTTLEKRGFQQMVEVFLDALETGVQQELKQENIWLSHQLCHEMLRHHQENSN